MQEAEEIAIVRASYRAFVDKDRAALEALIADDFHFTSAYENRIDRAAYFRFCWPGSATIAEFNIVRIAADGGIVFVTYESRDARGGRFRNTEVLTVRDNKIVEVEVYFGWTVPHEAPEGRFIRS